MYYQLTDQFHVAADLGRCWEFFSTAENLPLITPPWLRLTAANTGKIELDAALDYTIHWLGIGFKWRTKIIDFSPPRQFIDLQTRGRYRLWHHQHTFTPSPTGGVICSDRVIYAPPIPLVHALIIRRQLLEIFHFRRTVIGNHLGWLAA